MTTLDLRTLRLRPGEVRKETIEVELEPFVLGGQRYEATPSIVPVELEISQASGATVFDMRLEAHLSGACMRCLGFAEVARQVHAREFHDFDAPPADELHSEYVVAEHLQLSAWARDVVALERRTCSRALHCANPLARGGVSSRPLAEFPGKFAAVQAATLPR